MSGYNIILTENDVRVIFSALAEMPYRIAADVITRIHSQVTTQNNKEPVTSETSE